MNDADGKKSSWRNVKVGSSSVFMVGCMAVSANKELAIGSPEDEVLRFAEELDEWLSRPWYLVDPARVKVLRFALSKIAREDALPGVVVDRSKEVVQLLCRAVEGNLPLKNREELIRFCAGFHEAVERFRAEHAL